MPWPSPFPCRLKSAVFIPLKINVLIKKGIRNPLKKSPYGLPLWEKCVLLHPLSGTEAALLGSFEKKLGEKFGSKGRKSLSLRPLSAKRGGLYREAFYDKA